MSDGDPRPESLRALIPGFSSKDQLDGLALHAIVRAADAEGTARLREVAAYYRDDYLHALRMKGGNAEREAGRLGQDEVRSYLIASILPRLAESGVIGPLDGDLERDAATVRISPNLWKDIAPRRAEFAEAMRETGEHSRVALSTPPRPALIGGSVLEAQGLTKVYRGRKVVNDVALRLQQGEIVGLLGPNGAGKTTTFYMIVGLIPPDSGRILLDGQDISKLPMYERARRGIGYLSQEPSIFRKLSVEDNILAILETLPLSSSERSERLEKLLDELSIKRLRKSKAYALSGGERRRLEITRALVTDPKFMMLDEPFAGVDPIAVHDIQTIVAGLRHRGIGVLISDHNVEQTLDIVDRAYIMFDGQVKVSGTVRELVFDDTVADIYLGPTLTARLRDRFARDKDEVTVS
jgi:lipopolysaccharide export system ATP-binding protein